MTDDIIFLSLICIIIGLFLVLLGKLGLLKSDPRTCDHVWEKEALVVWDPHFGPLWLMRCGRCDSTCGMDDEDLAQQGLAE